MNDTILSKFTPSLMSAATLEAIFVQREELARRIIELITDSALTPAKHHTLLIGPRGIGKTHFVSVVYHRIKAIPKLHSHLKIAWLREDEWGITSLLQLLLRILRAIIAEFPDKVLAAQVETLYTFGPEVAERGATKLLLNLLSNHTLLVLIENLDQVFSCLGDEGQKRLRSLLQENPSFTILATSQSLFNGVSQNDSPFHGFFRINHLDEFTIEQAGFLLEKLAKIESDGLLIDFIRSPAGRARIRALHHLAGGNPRIYIIFSGFLTRDALDRMVAPFMRMIDDLTPYYQSRIAWLSPQQRLIVELLCERGCAIPVKEIAQRTFATHQVVSSQLKDLREKGYVRAIALGREVFYELHEPLMRLCVDVKGNHGEPIRMLVEFIRLWYSLGEIQERLTMLREDAAIERQYLLHALNFSQKSADDPRIIACLRDAHSYHEKRDYAQALHVAEELVAIRGEADDYLDLGICRYEMKRFVEAVEALEKAVELAPTEPRAWAILGLTLYYIDAFERSSECLNRAIQFGSRHKIVWKIVGLAMIANGRIEEALEPLAKVTDLDPTNSSAWEAYGEVLGMLNRPTEALTALDIALELDELNASAWGSRGVILVCLLRYDDAIVALGKATTIDPALTAAWKSLGRLFDKMRRLPEAVRCFEMAVDADGLDSEAAFECAFLLAHSDEWVPSMQRLDAAFRRFGKENDDAMWTVSSIVFQLIRSTGSNAFLQDRLESLSKVCNVHDALSVVNASVLGTGKEILAGKITSERAHIWNTMWRNLSELYPELSVCSRLLNALIQYHEHPDPRALLKLPVEERKVVEALLKVVL